MYFVNKKIALLLMQNSPMTIALNFDQNLLLKFLKFGIVGGSGVVIDFFFTWLLKEKFKVHKYLANTIGFTIAASTNWFFNRIWTFKSTNQDVIQEYSNFLFVSLIGLAINNAVLWIFTDKLKFNFYFAKLIAIAITTIWNFFANYIYTFNAV